MNEKLIKELYGDLFSSQGALRGKIFKKLQKSVKDLKSFKNVLRYNGYKLTDNNFPDDPSKTSPGHGISARFDLEQKEINNLSGGIDCKLTDGDMMKKMSTVIISGPTKDNNKNLPVFSWLKKDSEYAEYVQDKKDEYRIVGLPSKYDFDWYLASPQTLQDDSVKDKFSFDQDKEINRN